MTKTTNVAGRMIYLIVPVLLLSPHLSGQNTEEQGLLDKMRSFDNATLGTHTLVVNMQYAAARDNDLDRGQKLTKITVTTHAGAMAIEREISYTDVPAYRAKTPATEIDYRPDDSLIVWRTTRSRSLMELGFQAHQDESMSLLVSPDGQIREVQGSSSFDLYRPSDTQRYLQFWTPVWTTGRGFVNSLSRITETSRTDEGLISLRASGFLNPRTQGAWQMVVDPQAGYLVRSATFTPSGHSNPSFVCTTSGTKWFDACSVAERGTISRAYDLAQQMVTTTQIERYTPEPAMNLLEECRRILHGPFPRGAKVYDWVANPDGHVFAYIAGDLPISDKDLLNGLLDDPTKDAADKPQSDGAADSVMNNSGHGSEETNAPSRAPPAQGSAQTLPASGRRLWGFWMPVMTVLLIAIAAIGVVGYATKKE